MASENTFCFFQIAAMEDETGSIGRLESEALKRKKRLEALKRAKQQPGQEQEQEPMDQSNEDTSLPK